MAALRQFGELDRQVARRIVDRVGDYRLLCELLHAELVILTLEVGHRGAVYD